MYTKEDEEKRNPAEIYEHCKPDIQDGQVAYSDEEGRAILRKVDYRLLPVLTLLYLLSFLDRGNGKLSDQRNTASANSLQWEMRER